jgi:putative zinc finger protein
MLCEEAQELITARVDDELTVAERTALESHLQTCRSCMGRYAVESRLKRQTHAAAQRVTAPAALRRAIEERIGAGTPETRKQIKGDAPRGLRFSGWRPALAMAAVLVIVAVFAYVRWNEPMIGVAALAMHESIVDGKIVLARSDNPLVMREQLAKAVGGRFRPVTLDLSALRLYPVSGFLRKIDGRDVLITVYQGDGPAVTCFTFLGNETDAPAGAEKFYDADMRVNFYSFSRQGINGLLHREGEVICLLASRMAPADLLAILRGKTAHA